MAPEAAVVFAIIRVRTKGANICVFKSGEVMPSIGLLGSAVLFSLHRGFHFLKGTLFDLADALA